MENFVFLEIKKKNQQCGLLGPDPAMGNSGSYFFREKWSFCISFC